MKKFRDMF